MVFGQPKTTLGRMKTKDKAAAETGVGSGKVSTNHPHGFPLWPQSLSAAPALSPSL